MRGLFPLSIVVLMLSAPFAFADPTVTFTLESPQNSLIVLPDTPIVWTIKATATPGNNAGLALAVGDLVQNVANPSFIDLPPAGGVPTGMENFSRPLGVSNPGEGGAATGYIGVQRSPMGQTYMNLVQIGGGQNTFGMALAPGTGIGESANVVASVGLGTPVVIASGSFPAPSVAGDYEIHLTNALANVLNLVSPPSPPAFWPVSPAAIQGLSGAKISITVSTIRLGDLNCDSLVNLADIGHFVQALVDPAGYDADHDGDPYPACQRSLADMTQDGNQDGSDIQLFVNQLLAP